MEAVLYISYDGLLEPLGQSQVWQYLSRLGKEYRIALISYEKPEDLLDKSRMESMRETCKQAGVDWYPLRYHKTPTALATAYDIFVGIFLGLKLAYRYHFRIVHARSYVPSVIALALKRLTGIRYIFDMRGFWADERVDGGLWPQSGRLYRMAKSFERRFLLAADHVVSLTHAAVAEMRRFPYLQERMPSVTVIPTCADLTRFKARSNEQEKAGFVLGYVGSAGTWYLFDEVVACFVELLQMRPGTRFLIVNRNEHTFICERLSAAGVPAESVELISATHGEVAQLIARMDAGIFFYRPAFSKLATAPTKLAEFLGCGKPCIGNAGVGDMAEVLEGERVGVALHAFDQASLKAGLKQLLALTADVSTAARCVAAAQKHFSLDEGVQRYAAIYRQLSSGA